MLTKEKLARISALAKKKKEVGLTEEEAQEQQQLRQEYLQKFRQGFKANVEGIKVVDEEGNDLTSEKIKDIQRQRGLRKTDE